MSTISAWYDISLIEYIYSYEIEFSKKSRATI